MVGDVAKVLNEQLPRYFRPIIEFQEIMKAHSRGLEEADRLMARLQANFYIPTCDEPTVAYYERLLGITCQLGDELDFRRMRVLQKLNITLPFTIDFLRDRLTALYGEDGYVLKEDSAACALTIKITSDRYRAVDLLYDLLLEILPAHIQLTAWQEVKAPALGRLYTGGAIFSILEQTIDADTKNSIDHGMSVAGIVAGAFIQTIIISQEE